MHEKEVGTWFSQLNQPLVWASHYISIEERFQNLPNDLTTEIINSHELSNVKRVTKLIKKIEIKTAEPASKRLFLQ